MALRDYILCGECEVKLIYDGNDDAREWLEERYGDPNCGCYTVKLLCPTCLEKLRAENAKLRRVIKDVAIPALASGAQNAVDDFVAAGINQSIATLQEAVK